VTAALVIAIIVFWLIAAMTIAGIEREHDLDGAMARLRIQRRREFREQLERQRRR
jgi:hypothetical protein